MKRFFALAAGIFLCLSCVSVRGPGVTDTIAGRPAADAFAEIHWITRPSGGTITVIGIAGRNRQRDEAIAEALGDAARRVSLYHGVHGESTTVLQDGSNTLDYFADTDYSLTLRNSPESYLDSLAFDKTADVYEKNGSVYIRTRYSGVLEVPAYAGVNAEASPPDWVNGYHTDIPGFLTGVGSSKNKGTPQKTYRASYENALVSVLPRISTRIESSVIDANAGKLNQNVSVSSGNLSKIMILETWFDKRTGIVWTLLAAKAE
jgi:hypothetical protein